jgi:hypothetical protein
LPLAGLTGRPPAHVQASQPRRGTEGYAVQKYHNLMV